MARHMVCADRGMTGESMVADWVGCSRKDTGGKDRRRYHGG
jgi:hypothetical protein